MNSVLDIFYIFVIVILVMVYGVLYTLYNLSKYKEINIHITDRYGNIHVTKTKTVRKNLSNFFM